MHQQPSAKCASPEDRPSGIPVPEDLENLPLQDDVIDPLDDGIEPCPLEECGTPLNLATIKDSLALAERLAQASLMTSPAARRRLQARGVEMGLGEDPGYIPPKHLLLYLVRGLRSKTSTTEVLLGPRHLSRVLRPSRPLRTTARPQPRLQEAALQQPRPRVMLDTLRPPPGVLDALHSPNPNGPMGSFNSAPKILNDDTEDDNLQLPEPLSQEQLVNHCQAQVNSPPLIARRFRHLTDPPESKGSTKSIRILQWNLLSQALGQNNDNFVCCPDEALEWPRRRFLIAEEIVRYSPDIVCLQEVDHFKFLQKVLGSQGFCGTFFPKPDSPCAYIKGNNGPDGCAIFYRSERFQLIRVETRVLEVWRVQSNQVAILVILRDRETQEEVCVTTTHLKARNGALLSALRNEQGKDLLEFVAQHAGGRPVVLCGDFNAEPTEPIYSTVLGHDLLRLTSAYRHGQDAEPPYTTWKIREEGEVCHTIDYVFCSQHRFTPSSLLEFPSGDEIGADRIPSLAYPSDHFSLVCDLQLTPCNLSH